MSSWWYGIFLDQQYPTVYTIQPHPIINDYRSKSNKSRLAIFLPTHSYWPSCFLADKKAERNPSSYNLDFDSLAIDLDGLHFLYSHKKYKEQISNGVSYRKWQMESQRRWNGNSRFWRTKSIPTVDIKEPLKESSAKRIIRADFPTPESPTSSKKPLAIWTLCVCLWACLCYSAGW